jgi:hypothetical protein
VPATYRTRAARPRSGRPPGNTERGNSRVAAEGPGTFGDEHVGERPFAKKGRSHMTRSCRRPEDGKAATPRPKARLPEITPLPSARQHTDGVSRHACLVSTSGAPPDGRVSNKPRQPRQVELVTHGRAFTPDARASITPAPLTSTATLRVLTNTLSRLILCSPTTLRRLAVTVFSPHPGTAHSVQIEPAEWATEIGLKPTLLPGSNSTDDSQPILPPTLARGPRPPGFLDRGRARVDSCRRQRCQGEGSRIARAAMPKGVK